ncbi:MAG: hypothetical protein A3D10_08205 [Omnitrophica WOR_2 bacterium RIFCSPHIGHO2_02_FULL_48_11]|nr:MAG: hypothetical protein A3D10_08205 [Omnitrophica WOR_2 bacterium RIFCSPHIGHO2_02_FULL_48_11]
MRQKRVQLLFIALCLPLLCGLANISVRDIETAIIQRNYHQAHNLAHKFISQNPSKNESDEAQYYLGLSLLYLQRYAQARETFHQLIQYQPEERLRDKVYVGIIDSYSLQEQYPNAIKAAQELLKLSPKSELESLIYLKLARAHLKLAEWDDAQKYLKKIVSHFPDSLETDVAKQLLEENQYFAVQLGAFAEQARAEQLVADVKNKGEYAYIVETTDSSGRKYYRVRVGQFSLLAEANKVKQKLSGLGYPTQVYP